MYRIKVKTEKIWQSASPKTGCAYSARALREIVHGDKKAGCSKIIVVNKLTP